jgi:methionyl-tRNA synthetase
MLVVWLCLHAGISRNASNTTLRALRFIIMAMLQIFLVILHSFGCHVDLPSLAIPKDIRTILKQGFLKTKIQRTVCCPSCFFLYPEDAVPAECSWKKSPRARKCGEKLLKNRHTRRGIKQVPRTYFTTQDFESWLSFFLSRPEIEDYLEQSFQKSKKTFHSGNTMRDISDSPFWQSQLGFLRFRYHLIFGIYIDWFNPFTNKIAGKFVSERKASICS